MSRLARACLLVGLLGVAAAAPGTWVRATYGAQLTADEPHYLVTAISLLEDADLDVSDEFAEERYRPFHELGLPAQAAVQDDGRMVVPHDPLLPALLAVPWWLGGWVGAKLGLSLLNGVLGAALVWTAVRRLGVAVRPAAVVSAVFVASAPLAVYGTQLYPELPAALAALLGFTGATGRTARGAALVVAAVVALPWLAVKYVPVAAAIAAVALWRWWRDGRRRQAVVGAGVLGAAGLVYAVAHLAWYGGLTVYAAGDFFQQHGGQMTVVGTRPDYLGRARRLIGLLIGDEFGLAAWQPAWLTAVPAVSWLARRRPVGWDALVVPLAAGWLTATFVALTMQGWWFPGRQVVVVLPLAVLAVAHWAGASRTRLRWVAVLGAAGVIAHAWLVVEGLGGGLTWVVDFASTTNPLYRAWKPLLPDYLQVTWRTWVVQGVWMVVLALLARQAWRAAGLTRSPSRWATPDR